MLGVLASAGLVACGGEVASEDAVARSRADLTAAAASLGGLGSGINCDDLLDRFKGVLRAQVAERAAQARVVPDYYYYPGVLYAEASAPARSAGVGGPAAEDSPPFSGTTGLVPGVDPSDFVKGEGDRIYLLHGQNLFVLNAASADSTEIIDSVAIEGSPGEFVLKDGKLIVVSTVYEIPGVLPVYNPYYGTPYYTKLTAIDTTGAAPAVVRESYLEGYYSGLDRSGSSARTVVQASKAQLDYPSVSYYDFFGHERPQAQIDLQVDVWVELATQSIDDSTLEDYLGAHYERVQGEIQRQPLSCEELALPASGDLQPGNTTLVSFDLSDLAAPPGRAFLLGYPGVSLVSEGGVVLSEGIVNDPTSPVPTYGTRLTLLEPQGGQLRSVGSASIDGSLYTTPSLHDGVLRLITAQDRYDTSGENGEITYLGTETTLATLAPQNGQLVVVGEADGFPSDEYISVANLAGDRGYVQTQGTTGNNRLYVVDLSDPSAPAIGNPVEVPGYGYVLVPLPGDRVLSVTQYADTINYTQRVALNIFDVSDPSAPSLAGEFAYAEEVYSDASYDPRVIALNADGSLLAFPVYSYTSVSNSLDVFQIAADGSVARLGRVTPAAPEVTLERCLPLLGYPNTPEFLEELQQDPAFVELLLQQCASYITPSIRRGLLRGDDVYALSSFDVSAYTLDALDGPPLSRVELPPVDYYYGYPGRPIPASPVPIATPVDVEAPAGEAPTEAAPE